jgi:hypothetical protein
LGLEVGKMSEFQAVAQGVSDRIVAEHGEGYGIAPVTIAAIVTAILPGVLKCWQDRDEVPPAAASDRIRRMHKRNPTRLHAKLARSINYGAQQKGHHLTVDQCHDMAAAMIAEAIGTTDEVVYGLCKASL